MENGLAGIGWGIEHLKYYRLIKGSTNEILSELDWEIMKINVERINDISFRKGFEGIVCYLLSRIFSQENRNNDNKPFDSSFIKSIINESYYKKGVSFDIRIYNSISGTMVKQVYSENLNKPDSMALSLSGMGELSLGDVQSAYSSFLTQIHEYMNYLALDYYPKKIVQTKKQIGQYKDYTLLQSRHSLEGSRASLDNLKIRISSQETALLDLELQQAEKESTLTQAYHRAAEASQNAINGWELNYCLISPISGKVTFTTYRTENLYVSQGENIFTVVPEESEELLGRAYLPVYRSGKVMSGQRVIIRFDNFPDQEFGFVEGRVSTISLVPSDENYLVEISLPNGLKTNYGNDLPASQEMKATADIVTEDLRLIERFFMPLKKVLREGF